MKRTRKTFTPESPTVMETIGYLKAQLSKRLLSHVDWDQPFISIDIGLGCPRHPVKVAIHSLILDRQAAIILYDLGIPDALETSRSYLNFNENYLSISGSSLSAFGQANREKILEWVAQREPRKPIMQQLHDMVVSEGFGEKLDALLASGVKI